MEGIHLQIVDGAQFVGTSLLLVVSEMDPYYSSGTVLVTVYYM